MSTDLIGPSIPAMTADVIEHVRKFEDWQLATQFQFDLKMHHTIHAGMYARTCRVPAGVTITGALIKIPTLLVIDGDCLVWLGSEECRITGHAVLPASAGRKQMFHAIKETHITMIFPTSVRTVQEAEREFTDEWQRLATGIAETVVTGELP